MTPTLSLLTWVIKPPSGRTRLRVSPPSQYHFALNPLPASRGEKRNDGIKKNERKKSMQRRLILMGGSFGHFLFRAANVVV